VPKRLTKCPLAMRNIHEDRKPQASAIYCSPIA
jgi:hypothetical protein